MSRSIEVYLGDSERKVGTLRFDVQGARQSAAFEYYAQWLDHEERFAIDPRLPLVRGMQFHKRVGDGSTFHGAIADTEPDGWGKRVILRDDAKQRQTAKDKGKQASRSAMNALDYLLAVDDLSRVGALRFKDEEGRFQRASEKGRRTAPPLVELGTLLSATKAVEANEETAADLAYLRGRGTSVGGLRPKCSVIDEDGTLSIAKFPSVRDDRPVTKGEVLALQLARNAGIETAEARLIDSDGSPVAIIRRFDREPAGRLMYVSAATLLGAERSDPQEHAYTEIIDVIRQHGVRVQDDIEELWRRIAFSILVTNVDDHLHNHGFLHETRGQWRLSPAFDVNPFPVRARELKTWISQDAGPEARIDALLSIAPYCRIPRERAVAIIKEVELAVSKWRAVAKRLTMTPREIDQFADAFEHEERTAARRL
ncbi:MAG: type II toxin-antitoxin system HipA family toxin, partial [Gammaproteobacteria bacterium]